MLEAYRRTRKDGATGIDGTTAADYEKELEANLADLLSRIKSGRYYAPPVRRQCIPKADGSQRPLGIPTIEDKVAQRAKGQPRARVGFHRAGRAAGRPRSSKRGWVKPCRRSFRMAFPLPRKPNARAISRLPTGASHPSKKSINSARPGVDLRVGFTATPPGAVAVTCAAHVRRQSNTDCRQQRRLAGGFTGCAGPEETPVRRASLFGRRLPRLTAGLPLGGCLFRAATAAAGRRRAPAPATPCRLAPRVELSHCMFQSDRFGGQVLRHRSVDAAVLDVRPIAAFLHGNRLAVSRVITERANFSASRSGVGEQTDGAVQADE